MALTRVKRGLSVSNAPDHQVVDRQTVRQDGVTNKPAANVLLSNPGSFH